MTYFVTVIDNDTVDSTAIEAPPATVITVDVGREGPVGPQGPPGLTDIAYTHHQSIPSDTWFIEHGLGFFPSVTIVDSTGEEVVGNVLMPTSDVVIVGFSAAFSGTAHLS